jgi:hypothetical protein
MGAKPFLEAAPAKADHGSLVQERMAARQQTHFVVL